jgi:hypothetical protein
LQDFARKELATKLRLAGETAINGAKGSSTFGAMEKNKIGTWGVYYKRREWRGTPLGGEQAYAGIAGGCDQFNIASGEWNSSAKSQLKISSVINCDSVDASKMQQEKFVH